MLRLSLAVESRRDSLVAVLGLLAAVASYCGAQVLGHVGFTS